MVSSNTIDYSVVETYLREALLLQGKLEALVNEKKNVVQRVENAKMWLQKQPEYIKFLQHLQDIYHQKNIGAFSELLSYFVKDVLNKDKEIVLESYVLRNLPALKIEARNNGQPESILEGNGGSIANIVSTGLRLIALSRMTNRRFILLDEPDCWLKNDHIPVFAKIIGEISQKLNIQTVIISHHHWSYFKEYGRVIELKTNGVHLTTEIVHDTAIPAGTPDDVIKTIVMRRFMSHYDTQYHLHPHLTTIIGENDIGKSVLATALKSMAYADSSDSYIMHHENEAQVLLELSDNRQLLWQRFRVTNQDNPQKVKFSFFKDGAKVTDAYSAHEVPLFISKELNISTLEDIDVHIGNQKQPVFLLSSDVKPSEKAKILSLGKDSLIIQKMMEHLKSKKTKNKNIADEGERQYNLIERQISVLENIETTVTQLEDLKTEAFYLSNQEKQIGELIRALEIIEPLEQAAQVSKVENFNIEDPILRNVDDLLDSINNLDYYSQTSSISKVDFDINEIDLKDTSEISQLINNISKIEILANMSIVENDIEEISLHDTLEIAQLISNITKVEHLATLETVKDDIENIDFNDLYNTKELNNAISLISKSEKASQLNLIDINIETPVLESADELINLIKELEDQQNIINKLANEQIKLDTMKASIEKQVEQFIEQHGATCPTCLQHINKEHILGNEHA